MTAGFTLLVVPELAAAEAVAPKAAVTTNRPAKAIFLSIGTPCGFLVACSGDAALLDAAPESGESNCRSREERRDFRYLESEFRDFRR